MKNTLLFICFVLVITGVLYLLSGKKYPPIPSDSVHSVAKGESMCGECHGPLGKFPRKPGHPPKDECFKCHKEKMLPPKQQK